MKLTNRRPGTVLVLLMLLTGPLPVLADALPSMAMLGLFYRMSKNRVGAEDARQVELSDVDAQLARAYQSGRVGEARRQLARGLALANGDKWGDKPDFNASLVVRTDRSFVDPGAPFVARLGQIFPSTLARPGRMSVQVALHEPGQSRRANQPGKFLQKLGEIPDVGLDLIESPAPIQIDLSAVADGDYDLNFEVYDGDEVLGSASTRVRLRSSLDQRLTNLRKRAAAAKGQVQADILYPLDYMRKIDAGLVGGARFDLDEELQVAEATAKGSTRGRDPFSKRTGGFERHYLLEGSGEIMPYRLYVPTTYDAGKSYPLIVALHGLGGNEDSMVGDFYGMQPLAEAKGYIIVSPMGFRVDGGYGGGRGGVVSRNARLSEADVMQVLELTRGAYSIDAERIFLMGHSMGAIGTWRIAARYPDIWAGLGPIAGYGVPQTAEKISHIAQVVVHGDADRTVPVTGSQAMVAALREAGADIEYIEVPGGGHSDIAPANMAKIFDFFDVKRRKVAGT